MSKTMGNTSKANVSMSLVAKIMGTFVKNSTVFECFHGPGTMAGACESTRYQTKGNIGNTNFVNELCGFGFS